MHGNRPELLTTTSRAFADQLPRADRLLQIRSALESGCYRIPTHVLTACLMFEMLQ